jgi:chorismate dehydratase
MIRVGIIDFSNSFPLFYAIKKQTVPHDISITCGTPVEINEKLRTGKVDIALVSSHEFLQNISSYTILSNLGIGATRQVMSVRMFFKKETTLPDLQTVYIPSHSATSVHLLKVLCTYFWKVSPKYELYTDDPKTLFFQEKPFLIIGDDCLRHMNTASHSSIDLAQSWYEATSESFIFAVIAARKEAFKNHLNEISSFHQTIHDSYEWAQANIEVIIEHAAEITGCNTALIRRYYSTVDYRLTESHFKGLKHFSSLEL